MNNFTLSKQGRFYQKGQPLSADIRSLIVQDYLSGQIKADIARKYKLHDAVSKIIKRYQTSGSLEPGKPCRGNPAKLDLIKLIKEMRPSTQLLEIQRDLLRYCNLPTGISISTVSKRITDELRMSYKKLTAIKPEKFTQDNIRYCQEFLNYMATVPKVKTKFYDESGIDFTVCNATYSHSKIGERAVEIVKGKKGTHWSLLLLCSLEGIDYTKLIPIPTDTVEYLRFFGEAGQLLTPLGRQMFTPGDHVVLDNAPIHVHDAAQALGQWLSLNGSFLVFTPYYSPEFNVAELVFNYLKIKLKDPTIRDNALQNLPATVYAILSSITPALMARFYLALNYMPL